MKVALFVIRGILPKKIPLLAEVILALLTSPVSLLINSKSPYNGALYVFDSSRHISSVLRGLLSSILLSFNVYLFCGDSIGKIEEINLSNSFPIKFSNDAFCVSSKSGHSKLVLTFA